MTQYVNEYGTTYAVQEYKGEPRIMCRAKDGSDWLVSGTLAVVAAAAKTIVDVQDVLDNHAREHGWQPVEAPASAEPPLPMPGDVYRSAKSGQLYKIGELTNGKKTCYLTMRSNAQGSTWVPANSSVYPNLSDAQGEFEAWIRTEQLEPVAPNGDAAATTAVSAVPMPSTAAGTTTTSASGEGADSCETPAPDAQPNKEPPAELAPTAPTSLPAFDYSGLDDNTAERLKGLAERANMLRSNFVTDMALIVSSAHWYLCGVVAPCDNSKHGNRGDKSFRAWCASIGIGKDTAYRLLNVQTLIDGSTDEELRTLEKAPAKLLYAAAKPSAPPELVQAFKDGDITTYKQYQDLLARYNAEKAAREKAEREAALERKEQEDANSAALRYKNECDRRAQDQQRLEGLVNTAKRERDDALRRAAEAEKQRDGAREALTASKLRGDKLKAENEALKAQPVEAQVVDEEEVNRRAQARAAELTAPLREELEALRNRHPADPEAAEQAIRDAYDSAIYTGRVMENAWHTLRPLLPRMDAHRRELAIQQVSKTLAQIQGEIAACL